MVISIGYRERTKRTRKPVCEKCLKVYKWKSLDVHHKDLNRKNNDPNNLQVLCKKCHKGMPLHKRYTIPKIHISRSKPIYVSGMEEDIKVAIEDIVPMKINMNREIKYFLLNSIGGITCQELGRINNLSRERIRHLAIRGQWQLASTISKMEVME